MSLTRTNTSGLCLNCTEEEAGGLDRMIEEQSKSLPTWWRNEKPEAE